MKAWPWLMFFGLALAAAGAPHSFGQVPDAFTREQLGPPPAGPGVAGGPKAGPGMDCNAEFGKRNTEMQKRGLALKAASERKGSIKDACALLRRYVASEADMIGFLKKASGPCGIPPDILKQMNAGYAKSSVMRDQVCKVATQQMAAPPPPPPSQGLSGVLGSSGSAPADSPGGSGVFDSLTGNVLRQ